MGWESKKAHKKLGSQSRSIMKIAIMSNCTTAAYPKYKSQRMKSSCSVHSTTACRSEGRQKWHPLPHATNQQHASLHLPRLRDLRRSVNKASHLTVVCSLRSLQEPEGRLGQSSECTQRSRWRRRSGCHRKQRPCLQVWDPGEGCGWVGGWVSECSWFIKGEHIASPLACRRQRKRDG